MFLKLKLIKNESGQAMIIAALSMVVIFGFAALVIDIGRVSVEKRNLQNIADSAALGGAADLPSSDLAKVTAVNIANDSSVTATTVSPYNGDNSKIQVTVSANVDYTFAKILGFTSKVVSVSAVAQKNVKWSGDALPFINLDGYGELPLSAWNMTGPGDKERINNNSLIINVDSIQVKYQDAFVVFKKGLDFSQIAEPLEKIAVIGNTVYIISIKESEIVNYQKGGSKELKEGNKIPLVDTVLLECKVTETWGGTGSDIIKLEFIESFAWNGTTYVSADGEKLNEKVKLVK